MTWLIAALVGSAGLFYGLWQHSRASRYLRDWDIADKALALSTAVNLDMSRRYEQVVSSLKAEVRRLEDAALSNATPDQLRDRLSSLLRPRDA